MHRFGRVQEYTADGEAIHRGLDLLSYLAALANSTDDKLAAAVDRPGDDIDRVQESFLSNRVRM